MGSTDLRRGRNHCFTGYPLLNIPQEPGSEHLGQAWCRLFIEIISSEILTVSIVSLTKGTKEILLVSRILSFQVMQSCTQHEPSWQMQKSSVLHSLLFVPWELSWVPSSGAQLLTWHCILMKFSGNKLKIGKSTAIALNLVKHVQ